MKILRWIICLLFSFAFSQASAEAEAGRHITSMAQRAELCPDTSNSDLPGASPENPISVGSIAVLYRQLDENFPDYTNSSMVNTIENKLLWEGVEAISEPNINLTCKWISAEGYFRWSDFFHFRGTAHPSAWAYHSMRDISVYVESFSDPEQRRAEINGADIKIVGRFYDFCNASKPVEFFPLQPGYMTLDGPCFMTPPGMGLTLYDVRVEKILRRGPTRLLGEINRDVIGDLKEMPANWEHYERARDVAQHWLKTVFAGREALEAAVREGDWAARGNKQELAELEADIRDPDSWFGYLTDPKRSPLKAKKSRIKRMAFKIYKHVGYRSYGGTYWGCWCHLSSCDDKWPLFMEDAGNFADSYVCVLLDHDEGAGTWDWFRYWD